jgi:ketosteroid isomerase-like protein
VLGPAADELVGGGVQGVEGVDEVRQPGPRALAALLAVEEALRAHSTLPVPKSARATVLSFFAALDQGRIEDAMTFVAPDAIWSIPGDPARLPWAGQHFGRTAVAHFYATLSAHTKAENLRLGEVIAHGDTVHVRGEFVYSFPGSGGHYAGAFVIVFTIRDGLVGRYEMHEDSLGLVGAFGNAS